MEIVFGHGKSAGMVCPDKALDPAHSDSQRLSLALFPGTSQAAAMAVKISEIHQLFVAELSKITNDTRQLSSIQNTSIILFY